MRAYKYQQHLDGGLWVGLGSRAVASRGHAFPSPPQHHVDLHVDQQCDDEGNVERDDGGVHHKGRVSNAALRKLSRHCKTHHGTILYATAVV